MPGRVVALVAPISRQLVVPLVLAASLVSANAFGGTKAVVQNGDPSTIADFFDGLRAWELKEKPTAAAIWLRAAEWGDVRSMEKIGELFERGEVLPHDTTLAYFWFSQAAQRGVASARAAADRLRNQLPAVHLSEVDASIANWQPKSLETAVAPEKKSDEPILVPGNAALSFATGAVPKPGVADLLAALDDRDIYRFETVLSSGVSANSLDPDGVPVIFLAVVMDVRNQSVNFVSALLKKGADPNARLSNGMTPLHIAAGLGSLAVVETLVNTGGASAGTQDPNGVAPLDLAERKNFGDVARFLRNVTLRTLIPNRPHLAAPGLR